MGDFEIFYSAAVCFAGGQSPYTCANFFYPLPTVFLFLPLVAFPLPMAKIVWGLALLASLVVVCKRAAVWFVLYVPVLQVFWLGQIDLILLPAIVVANGGAMALLTLKPQLIWFYLPIWFIVSPWRERSVFLIVSAIMWGASFLAWPGWIVEFLRTTRPLSQAAYASPSLWGGGWLPWQIAILLGIFLVYITRNKWSATMTANPAIISYDLVVLLPYARWWLVPVSWATQWASNLVGSAWPHVMLSLLVAIFGKQDIRISLPKKDVTSWRVWGKRRP